MSQQDRKTSDANYPLFVAVIRKITKEGAVLIRHRLFRPNNVLSTSVFDIPCRKRDWDGILDATCRACGLRNSYFSPQKEICQGHTPEGPEYVSMVHLINLNGPVASLFQAMTKTKSTNNGVLTSDILANVSSLMLAIEGFPDPLVTICEASAAKIRFLNIPQVIPLGKSELSAQEEQDSPATMPQSQASAQAS